MGSVNRTFGLANEVGLCGGKSATPIPVPT
jgi:hypothetical protein